ncbi:hypothetical protein [Stomatohabitans albus]|uniref:hypothetical protein n=1 Tax=Stomatohabitans albus TaxID=3110766 RepID=UPI00300D68D7
MRKIVTATKTLKRPVMAVATASELGRVSGFGVDPETCRVAFVRFGRGSNTRLVAWETLAGIGPDAVMVADHGRIKAPHTPEEELIAHGDRGLLGHRVLSEIGNDLGTVTDFDFDATSGEVLRIVTDHMTLDGDVLRRVGPAGVIVTADVDPVYADGIARAAKRRPIGALPEGPRRREGVASDAEKDALRAEFARQQAAQETTHTEVTWVDVDSVEVDG